MADATTARSDDASRDEQLRPVRGATPIIATATLLGDADAFHTRAERACAFAARATPPLKQLRDKSYEGLCQGQYGLLHLIPAGDDRDLMILAGHASMLADQLTDFLDGGDEHARKVCAGIKAWYEPESLVGTQVVIVANLESRTIRGEVSQGMILAGSAVDGEGAKGDVCVLRVDRPLPPGSKVS